MPSGKVSEIYFVPSLSDGKVYGVAKFNKTDSCHSCHSCKFQRFFFQQIFHPNISVEVSEAEFVKYSYNYTKSLKNRNLFLDLENEMTGLK